MRISISFILSTSIFRHNQNYQRGLSRMLPISRHSTEVSHAEMILCADADASIENVKDILDHSGNQRLDSSIESRKDILDEFASRKVESIKIRLEEGFRCPRCWLKTPLCVCEKVTNIFKKETRIKSSVALFMHFKEFGRVSYEIHLTQKSEETIIYDKSLISLNYP